MLAFSIIFFTSYFTSFHFDTYLEIIPNFYKTILHKAIEFNFLDIVELLIAPEINGSPNNIDVNIRGILKE